MFSLFLLSPPHPPTQTQKKKKQGAPPVDPRDAAIAHAAREAEEAAAALEAARQASEAASRHLEELRAYARVGLIDERGELMEPPAEILPNDIWRGEIFPQLSALDTINAAAVSRSWEKEVASGIKGRGEIVIGQGNLLAPEQARRIAGPGSETWRKVRTLFQQQTKLVPPPLPPPQPPQQQQQQPPQQQQQQQQPQQQQQQQQQQPQQQQQQPQPHPESLELQRKIRSLESRDIWIREENNCGVKPGLAERCRANSGSARRLQVSYPKDRMQFSKSELEAVASLVSDLPLISMIDVSASWIVRDLSPGLLPCLLRAVAEGVAASSPDSARGGGGNVRVLALRGWLETRQVLRQVLELPQGWAEGLGISSSSAVAAAATAGGASTSAAGGASTSGSTSTSRPYEEGTDVALASSALALLAKNSPIEKLALDIRFWQPEEGPAPPQQRQPAAEAVARRAAPRTLGALLQPLGNQLVDLSVDSEQWRRATRGGFAREGASAPPAPSSEAAAANSRPPPGLGPLPSVRVLRLVGPADRGPVAFLLSRASFEGIVSPSTLHFMQCSVGNFPGLPFAVVAEDDGASVVRLAAGYYRRGDLAARLGTASPARLDAALAPLADCVTELLIDVAETSAQTFPYGFTALRGLRRLAVRLASPGTSSAIPPLLNLSAFSQAHGRLTSLDVSGFVRRKLTAATQFPALRRLVMRGIRNARGQTQPFYLPSQRGGGFAELEFLAAGFQGYGPGRAQFSDREWFARFCELQSRQSQGQFFFFPLYFKFQVFLLSHTPKKREKNN